MANFTFDTTFQVNQARCGWCLDWIMSPPNEKSTNCPYCGANLSTKSPRYDEMLSKIRNVSEIRHHDHMLKNLRKFQFQKKYGKIPSQYESTYPSPLISGPIRHLWPVGEGTIRSWGMPLMTLLEKLHANPTALDDEETKEEIRILGNDIYNYGKIGQMISDFDSAVDELLFKYTPDFDKYRVLWNDICDQWKY